MKYFFLGLLVVSLLAFTSNISNDLTGEEIIEKVDENMSAEKQGTGIGYDHSR